LKFSRRHVLGDLYPHCDPVLSIPVYWNEVSEEPLGFVRESGEYSDAFDFHIADEFCRKLASGQLTCRFNYEYVEDAAVRTGKRRRVRLTSFVLTPPKGYEKAVSVALSPER
jgi:hypothetical protein